MDVRQYKVAITNASDQPVLGPTGAKTRHFVTYYVDDRGPFKIEMDPTQATDAAISAEISKRVSTLRALDSKAY